MAYAIAPARRQAMRNPVPKLFTATSTAPARALRAWKRALALVNQAPRVWVAATKLSVWVNSQLPKQMPANAAIRASSEAARNGSGHICQDWRYQGSKTGLSMADMTRDTRVAGAC